MMTYKNLFETPAYTMCLLKPRPVVARITNNKEHVVFWNGIIMPYAAALYIAVRSGNVFPTPSVKQKMDDKFRRLRGTEALRKGDRVARSPINIPDSFTGYERVMRKHVASLLQHHTTKDLFEMLDIDKAFDLELDL